MDNAFILPDDYYHRDMDFVDAYQRDAALYLHLQTQTPLDECLAFVKKRVHPENKDGLNNPSCAVVVRDQKTQDRDVHDIPFMSFIQRMITEKHIMTPSMATYLPEEVKQSTHARFIEEGVKKRSQIKKEMLKAKDEGRHEDVEVLNGNQQNAKITNNSHSGATVSQSTILHYKSTHSSLTSTCRTATSYANAANEKFLVGNRHYYAPEIVKANLTSIINLVDLDRIEQACTAFGLHYPSVEDVHEMIKYSSDLYWKSDYHHHLIKKMIEGMTPVQRAAVTYVGDMYHLHKHNPDFVVGFLNTLARDDQPIVDVSDDEYDQYDEDLQTAAVLISYEIIENAGEDLKFSDVRKDHPQAWARIKSTAWHIREHLNQHKTLIEAFWLTKSIPTSIHTFPSSYRRAAIISDTDSTIFTMQTWVENCCGQVEFTPKAKKIAFAVTFLVSELIMHILAIQSANMGTSRHRLRLLSMKNEFYFAVMFMTTRSKHYFASVDAQEGLLLKSPEMEIKGVGLRDSKVPPEINKKAIDLMERLIETIKAGEKIQVRHILKEIADIERDIYQSIRKGHPSFMTRAQIKTAESYKNPDVSNYMQYKLWSETFGRHIMQAPTLPYACVKVSLSIDNKQDLQQWCDAMQNQKLAEDIKRWMLENRRTKLNTLLIPEQVIETYGIPDDIVRAIDIRRIIANTMGAFYLILESIGIFIQEKKNERLISDYY